MPYIEKKIKSRLETFAGNEIDPSSLLFLHLFHPLSLSMIMLLSLLMFLFSCYTRAMVSLVLDIMSCPLSSLIFL